MSTFASMAELTCDTCKSSRGLFQVLAQGGATGQQCSPQPFKHSGPLGFLRCRRKIFVVVINSTKTMPIDNALILVLWRMFSQPGNHTL